MEKKAQPFNDISNIFVLRQLVIAQKGKLGNLAAIHLIFRAIISIISADPKDNKPKKENGVGS